MLLAYTRKEIANTARRVRYSELGCLAEAALAALASVSLLNASQPRVAGGLVGLGLVVGSYLLLRVSRKYDDEPYAARLRLIGGVFAFVSVIGSNLYILDSIGLRSVRTWLLVACLVPACSEGLVGLIGLMREALSGERVSGDADTSNKADGTKPHAWTARIGSWYKSQRYSVQVLLVAALIFGAWLLWYPGVFPGVYGYDAIYQVRQYALRDFNAWHPVIHTMFLGWCVLSVGEGLLGSITFGVAVYALLQAAIMSLLFADVAVVVGRFSSPKTTLLSALLFCLVPCFPLMAFSATKDSLFAAFFAAAMAWLYVAVRKGTFYPAYTQGKLVALSVAAILLRNNAIYAFALTFVLLLICYRKRSSRVLPLIAIPIVLAYLCNSMLTASVGAESTSIGEALSVPLVQLARAMEESNGEIPQEDMDLASEYIPDWSSYQTGISDLVKRTFNAEKFKENPAAFLDLWLRIGLKEPVAYAVAALELNEGYWYFGMEYPIPDGYQPYLEYQWPSNQAEYNNHAGERGWYFVPTQGDQLPQGRVFRWFADGGWQGVPGLAVLVGPGTYIWVMLAALCICHIDEDHAGITVLAVTCSYWFTQLFGPSALFRYVLNLAACMPLFAMLCLSGGPRYERRA